MATPTSDQEHHLGVILMIKTDKLVTGSFKSMLVASKLRLRISQLVHQIATQFQRLYLYFLGSNYHISIVAMLYDQIRRNRKCKSKMVASKLRLRISQLVRIIATKF